MKERTVLILKALVEDFIETASPVASQKLLSSNQFKISSATVRNEFSMLEEVGLIVSPHVSAKFQRLKDTVFLWMKSYPT